MQKYRFPGLSQVSLDWNLNKWELKICISPKLSGYLDVSIQFSKFYYVGDQDTKRGRHLPKATQPMSHILLSKQAGPALLIPSDSPSQRWAPAPPMEGCALTVELNSLQASRETTSSPIVKPGEPQPGWYLDYRTAWGGRPDLALALSPEQR